MKKLKQIFKRIAHLKYKKYIVVLALGVFIVGFLGENSVLAHLRNKKRIGELRQAVNKKNEETKRTQEAIYSLQNDPKAVERVARQLHFMKAEDEDIYTLSDDQPVTDEEEAQHETVE